MEAQKRRLVLVSARNLAAALEDLAAPEAEATRPLSPWEGAVSATWHAQLVAEARARAGLAKGLSQPAEGAAEAWCVPSSVEA